MTAFQKPNVIQHGKHEVALSTNVAAVFLKRHDNALQRFKAAVAGDEDRYEL